jgi:hypothetical protein
MNGSRSNDCPTHLKVEIYDENKAKTKLDKYENVYLAIQVEQVERIDANVDLDILRRNSLNNNFIADNFVSE